MISTELMKKIRRIEIHTRRLVNDSFAGEYHAVFKGQGMEFDEVRPYIPGDEVRSIDWNVTARMGQPYIKRYIEERELTVMLLVDASRSGSFGSITQFKQELAAELAAVLAFSATTNQDKVGLLIFSDRVELFIPPRKGRQHVLRMIRDLLAFQPQGRGTDISLALETINRILKRRSILFLISDFQAEPKQYRKSLLLSERRHDIIAVDLNDPLENQFPNAGILALEDAESGDITWVDSSSRAWRESFSKLAQQATDEREQFFTGLGVDHITISTGQDYVSALMAFFRTRSKRLRR